MNKYLISILLLLGMAGSAVACNTEYNITLQTFGEGVEEEFTPVTECIEFVPETQQRCFNVKPSSAEEIIVLLTKKSHSDEWMESGWNARPLSKSNGRHEACLH